MEAVGRGKINWDLVATENGIPTSAAASLRWYRLRKSVNPGESAKEETKSEEGTAPPPAKRKRKRKAATPELKTALERGQSKSSREGS